MAMGIVVVWFVCCLFVMCESTHLDAIALRLLSLHTTS